MSRAVPPIVAAVALASALALTGCSDPAATLPVVKPSTQYPSTTSTTSTGPAPTSTGVKTLAPPTTSIAPAVHPAAVVERLVASAVTDSGVSLSPAPRTTPDEVRIDACPGGAAVTKQPGDTAVVRAWADGTTPSGRTMVIGAVTYDSIEAAATAAEPVLTAAGGCATPRAAAGTTVTVEQHRREVAEGMPLARVDLRTTAGATTTFTYLGVVQVGNVVVQLTMTGPDLDVLHSEGGNTLGALARKIQLAT